MIIDKFMINDTDAITFGHLTAFPFEKARSCATVGSPISQSKL